MSALMGAAALEEALATTREQRFATFVGQHHQRAVRMAWRLTGEDLAVAEEVAQDAFIRAWRALPGFRDEARLSTWFYRILVRQAANRRRWCGVRQRWGGLWGRSDAPVAEQAGARSVSGDPGLRQRIGLAMERLSPHQRTIFTLVHLEGFSVAEAAGIAGCAQGTAKSHLHRALGKLRADLGRAREEYGP